MPTGFKISSGLDFDDVFEPYLTGTKPANTGLKTSDNVDLANRYAPLMYGTAAAATGFKIASGADVNTLWAAKGTVSYTLPFNGRTFSVGETANTSQGTVMATAALNIKNDGNWTITGSTSDGPVTIPASSGTWLPPGRAAADYEVQLDTSGSTGQGTASNTAPAWASLSTTRAATITLPDIPATNAIERDDALTVHVRIRHATTLQMIADATCTLSVFTNGFS